MKKMFDLFSHRDWNYFPDSLFSVDTSLESEKLLSDDFMDLELMSNPLKNNYLALITLGMFLLKLGLIKVVSCCNCMIIKEVCSSIRKKVGVVLLY